MPNKDSYIHFYVAKNKTNNERYDICNIYTDHSIREYRTLEEVREFLQTNEPTHPMLRTSVNQNVSVTEINREDYLKTYTLYYNGYHNPYGMNDAAYNYAASQTNPPSDFGSFSYLVSASDNDVCATGVTNTQDNSDCDSDSYGDSNHLPYIIGKIGHPGD